MVDQLLDESPALEERFETLGIPGGTGIVPQPPEDLDGSVRLVESLIE